MGTDAVTTTVITATAMNSKTEKDQIDTIIEIEESTREPWQMPFRPRPNDSGKNGAIVEDYDNLLMALWEHPLHGAIPAIVRIIPSITTHAHTTPTTSTRTPPAIPAN